VVLRGSAPSQEDSPDPPTAELHLQRIGRVHGQHGNPVAARNLGSVAQMYSQVRNSRVELRVSLPALAAEADHRQFVGRPAGEMGDPVIVASRRNSPPKV
jgi:hypothetical protein